MLNFKGQLVYTLNDEDTMMIQRTFGSVSPNVAPLHVSLLSFAESKPFKKMWKGLDVNALCADIEAPAITKESIQSICKAQKTMDDGEIRIVHFIELGSNAWNEYRNAVLTVLDGGVDPSVVDPKEHYHITIENNNDGDPYKSIGDPYALPLHNENDFIHCRMPPEMHMANCMECGTPNTQECDEECGRMVCGNATILDTDCSTTCGVCLGEELPDFMVRWHLNDAIPDTQDA